MQHWFIDRQPLALPNWLEAMPAARLLARAQGATAIGSGILWFRQRSGEAVAAVLPAGQPAAGQHWVLLSDEPDEETVLAALAAGAAGCCNSYAAPDVLQHVALVVGNGGLWVGQSLLNRVMSGSARILEQQRQAAPVDDWSAHLSEREIEVARLVAGAASNKEIARQLDISERTVKAHLTSIFEKLGLRDRLQLSLRINGLSL
ncbi:MAG: response regulator transcription factor [Azonexus sp.]|jgi:DNA-binding NarL/FixJ family response regulator|uniref:helix-turn-helix domain-containing protein n=1 Tax=Azonexus sp. TaxID=1872668 RepID=UPI00281B97DC|nr:response regulator transcription factor [Azonexus sp.]MDR0777021.1 response regulator transcription factor [Azonexus sp.]